MLRLLNTPRLAGLAFVALAAVALITRAQEEHRPVAESTGDAAICDLRHPIDVRVAAVNEIQRGQSLTTRVTVRSEMDLENGSIEMTSLGGATAIGPRRRSLGDLPAGKETSTEFTVGIPAEGKRFLIQYRIEGEGPGGPMSRVGVFNVLPDGPADPGQDVTMPSGETIREYAARRIG